jgi:predicted aldo/keto reductase-like oxidoreductase
MVRALKPTLDSLKAQGLVKYIGFSTHAQTEVIQETIDTGFFDYINLHYHAFGSYTAKDNKACVENATRRDMGVFIISPIDKAGMLWRPSPKLAGLVGEDMSPIAFSLLWLLAGQGETCKINTFSIGAEKIGDWEEPLYAMRILKEEDPSKLKAKLGVIEARLRAAEDAAWATLGITREEYVKTPHCQDVRNVSGVAVDQILWLMMIAEAYGMEHYARRMYEVHVSNSKGTDNVWNPGKCAGSVVTDERVASALTELCGAKVVALLKRAHKELPTMGEQMPFAVPKDAEVESKTTNVLTNTVVGEQRVILKAHPYNIYHREYPFPPS